MTLREYHYTKKAYEYSLARQWDMAATMMALFANANSAKGKTFKPEDFHPLMGVNSKSKEQDRKVIFERMKKF